MGKKYFLTFKLQACLKPILLNIGLEKRPFRHSCCKLV